MNGVRQFAAAVLVAAGMAGAARGADAGAALDRAEVEREVAAQLYLFGLASGRDKAEAGVDWSRLEGMSGDELVEWADCVMGVNHAVARELAVRGFEEAGPEGRLKALSVAMYSREGDEGRELLERMFRAVAADLDEGRIPEELRWNTAIRLNGVAGSLAGYCGKTGDEEGEAAWRAELRVRSAQKEEFSQEIFSRYRREAEEEQRRDDAAAAAWKPGSAAERHYRRGWEWAELGRLRDAEAELRRAVERAREDGNGALADEAQAVLAEVLASSGRLKEARAECSAGLEAGSRCEIELLSTLARVDAAEGDTEAFCDTALEVWWLSRAEGGEVREWGDELASMAAGGMSTEHLEVWAELCGERLAALEWTGENRGEIVGLLILRWALEEFGHVTGGAAEWNAEEAGEEDGATGDAGAEAAEVSRKLIRETWKGWAWKTDPAVPEIEREFCSLLAGEGEEDGWAAWRAKWGEEACGELMVDGVGAWAVSLAEEVERADWEMPARREELLREAAEAFRKGKGFCAYRLAAVLRELGQCVLERERREGERDAAGGGSQRAADDTAWAEWADWATRVASGWRWAEGYAAWLRMKLALRMNDIGTAAREAREVLARCDETARQWGREMDWDWDGVEDAMMALFAAEDWAGVAEESRKAAASGYEWGVNVLCELADWLDAGAVAGTRELAERWMLATAGGGEEGLDNAVWVWRELDCSGVWTQARLAEMEADGTWNSEEGERFAREAQEQNPTLRGAGFLIRRAAARGDSAEAWRVWCGVVGMNRLVPWNSDDPAERALGEAWRRRVVEMSRWCGDVPEEVAEEVAAAWERVGVTSDK